MSNTQFNIIRCSRFPAKVVFKLIQYYCSENHFLLISIALNSFTRADCCYDFYYNIQFYFNWGDLYFSPIFIIFSVIFEQIFKKLFIRKGIMLVRSFAAFLNQSIKKVNIISKISSKAFSVIHYKSLSHRAIYKFTTTPDPSNSLFVFTT